MDTIVGVRSKGGTVDWDKRLCEVRRGYWAKTCVCHTAHVQCIQEQLQSLPFFAANWNI